jgi:hypothetical protein
MYNSRSSSLVFCFSNSVRYCNLYGNDFCKQRQNYSVMHVDQVIQELQEKKNTIFTFLHQIIISINIFWFKTARTPLHQILSPSIHHDHTHHSGLSLVSSHYVLVLFVLTLSNSTPEKIIASVFFFIQTYSYWNLTYSHIHFIYKFTMMKP